jgi:glycosyltransferase involved in cell wall biosynthesis
MKIAVDARGINWYKGTGIGTYTEKLFKNIVKLDNNNHYHFYWSGKDFENFKTKNTNIILTGKKQQNFFQQYYIPNNIKDNKIDIYHIPQNGIGFCKYIQCKKIVTIHDLIPYIMPLTVGKGYLLKFLREMPNIINDSDAIITVSEYSKKDILKFFPVDENKIFVTPLAADEKYKPLDKEKCKHIIKEKYHIDKPFILYLGGFSARKNIKSLILAFSKVYKKLTKKYNLVIVGKCTDQYKYLNDISNNLYMGSNIVFTGFVPEKYLPLFYNAAELFIYPSFYEGFGLPPLEAMSCGTPVIASNVSSIPEVMGKGGILINPYNLNELELAIENVLNDEKTKNHLIDKSIKQSSLFSWKKTAISTIKIYEEVLKKK